MLARHIRGWRFLVIFTKRKALRPRQRRGGQIISCTRLSNKNRFFQNEGHKHENGLILTLSLIYVTTRFYKSCHIHTEMTMKCANLLIRSSLGFSILLKYTLSQGFDPATSRLLDDPLYLLGYRKGLCRRLKSWANDSLGLMSMQKERLYVLQNFTSTYVVTTFILSPRGVNYASMWSRFTSMSEMADSRAQLQLTKPSERWIRPESHSLTKASVTALLKSWNDKIKETSPVLTVP